MGPLDGAVTQERTQTHHQDHAGEIASCDGSYFYRTSCTDNGPRSNTKRKQKQPNEPTPQDGAVPKPETRRRCHLDPNIPGNNTSVIAPATQAAGCQALHSDHEVGGETARTTMFERLLLADVVVADISIPHRILRTRHPSHRTTTPTITMGCFDGTGTPFEDALLRHLTYQLQAGIAADRNALYAELTERIRIGITERTSIDSPATRS